MQFCTEQNLESPTFWMMKSPVIPLLSVIFQEVTMKVRGRHQLWKNTDSWAQWSTLFLSLWYPSNLPCHRSPVKRQKLLARGLLLLAIFKAVSIKGNKSITDLNFLLFHMCNLWWNRWKLYLSIKSTTGSTLKTNWRFPTRLFYDSVICLGLQSTPFCTWAKILQWNPASTSLN